MYCGMYTETNITNSLGGMVAHAFTPNTCRKRRLDFCEFQASLALGSGFQGSQGNIMKPLLQENNFFLNKKSLKNVGSGQINP